MHLVHPDTPELREQRDQLLQRELRPEGSAFAIAEEYPLVLGPAHWRFSYCLVDAGAVVAHANLWPRQLVAAADQHSRPEGTAGASLAVGLVGNVATTASRQGQGLMTKLMHELQGAAREQGLAALLLWSDLQVFYQKMGFASYAAERRYLFNPKRLPDAAAFACADVAAFSDADLERLLALRPRVGPVVQRSTAEFRELLKIPQMTVAVRRVKGEIDCFAVLGKGEDMAGVVHEWGGADVASVLAAVRAAAGVREAVMLLAPAGLPRVWHEVLERQAASWEECGMALAWRGEALDRLVAVGEDAAQVFVWGLDAI